MICQSKLIKDDLIQSLNMSRVDLKSVERALAIFQSLENMQQSMHVQLISHGYTHPAIGPTLWLHLGLTYPMNTAHPKASGITSLSTIACHIDIV